MSTSLPVSQQMPDVFLAPIALSLPQGVQAL